MDIRDFRNDNNKYIPSIIWDWCAKPSSEEIDSKLKVFSDMGIKKVYIRPSDALIIPYLCDEYFELIRTCARRSAKYNIKLYLFDENSASSGNGGGEITSVADYCMREIVPLNESTKQSDDIEIDENYVLRDMSRHFDRKYSPITDITNDFITECFIDAVYKKHINQCKRFIGYEIEGIVTQVSLPENSVLYSEAAHKKITADKDVTLSSLSNALLSQDKEHHSLKNEYYNAFSFLASSSFISKISAKCHENNLRLTCLVDGATYISRQCSYMLSDSPALSIDPQNIDYIQIKLLTSICEQFDKKSVAFIKTPSFSDCALRYEASMHLASLGINEISFDSVAFSLSDKRKHEPFTTVLSPHCEKDMSKRISRMLNIVNETSSDADVLVLYPSSYLNALHCTDTEKEKKYYKSLHDKLFSLIKDGVSFHLVDEYIFLSHSAISDNKIRIGSVEYSRLVLPECEYLDEKTISVINSVKSICHVLEKSDMFTEFPLFNTTNKYGIDIKSDNSFIVSYRSDENNRYAFLTSTDSDCLLTINSDSALYYADIPSGEIYKLASNKFTLLKGRTIALISSSNIHADDAPPLFEDIRINEFSSEESIPFALSFADENIFPLKIANVCLGKKSYINANIDDIHKDFYYLADGETVKVKYPFFTQTKELGKVFLYVENANAIDTLLINGKSIESSITANSDNHFYGYDLTDYIACGKNMLSLEYKKHNIFSPNKLNRTPYYHFAYTQSSLEAVYLVGDFDIIDETLCPASEYTSDVTLSGMPNYYGSLTYLAKLPENTSGKVLFIEGNYDICSVKIGKRKETFFSQKLFIELFGLDCDGTAEITIYNTPYNLFKKYSALSKPFGIKEIKVYEQ